MVNPEPPMNLFPGGCAVMTLPMQPNDHLRCVDWCVVACVPRQLSNEGARALQEMLPHPAADSGFGTMLFKAQLSTSRLRANLEQEYQATINFVFKALLEVCSCLHDAVADSDLLPCPPLAINPRPAKCQPLAFWHHICTR